MSSVASLVAVCGFQGHSECGEGWAGGGESKQKGYGGRLSARLRRIEERFIVQNKPRLHLLQNARERI